MSGMGNFRLFVHLKEALTLACYVVGDINVLCAELFDINVESIC